MIHKILSIVFANSLILYVISKYLPQLWFAIDYKWSFNLEILLLLWAIFWIINDIIRKVIQLVALPITVLTMGLFSFVINVWIIYAYKFIINNIDWLWVEIQLNWWFVNVLLIAFIIAIFNLLYKKI